ncbi:MAG: alpha/beta hydrolase [Ardenticatenaceae bacterium]|nr:alpha/beta hydrolase [Anaerolineales bacterium]MCB8939676.1 alpha/beta hydrolase [Ardenticatenaceae bacterium]MCB8974899.1 alpha/beta hydrolase [Ardenticatenaceae bacterium]
MGKKRGRMGTFGWIILGLLVVGLGTAVWYGNRLVGQSADRLLYPRHTQPSQTPADFGLTAENVHFSADGVELAAWFVPPTEVANGATLIYVHGFGGNRGALLAQAAAMHGYGYGALLLDMRHHGDSGDSVSTWGYAEANDVIAAYNYLLTRPEVDASRIGLVGKSMGGAAVAQAAAQLPDTAVLILESTYSSFEENLVNIMPSIGRGPGFLAPYVFNRMDAATSEPLTEIRTVDTVTQLTMPLLLVHGEQDRLVPLAQGQAIFAAANEPKQLYTVPGAGHLDIFTIDSTTFTAQMHAFLAEYLPVEN